VAGIGNTLGAPFANAVREGGYNRMKWYANLIQQEQHNWGFFSFVPTETVRIDFFRWDATANDYVLLDEYSLVEAPFVGRHNMFNFVKNLVDQDKKYDKIRYRYVQWYCRRNNISDETVYLTKKYAALPKEKNLHYYDWSLYEPEWEYHTVATVYCPAL
jgi:hypothetical protein